MKFLTSLYRQALLKDFKNSNTRPSAYNVQLVLYENQRVFGNLYRFENFRIVFGTPPVSSQFLDFLSFWKGVESVLDGKYEEITLLMPDLLQKSCYVEDKYVISLRFFRDEVLSREVTMTTNELIEIIENAQKNSDLNDFWPKVLENTKKIFNSDTLSILDISHMVFTFFDRHYSRGVYLTSELERLTTSRSGDEMDADDNSLLREPQLHHRRTFDRPMIEIKFEDEHNSWTYEYKYRKLLFDLENSLPKFYTFYSDARSALMHSREQIKRLLETNDSLTNQFSLHKIQFVDKNSRLEEELRLTTERNSSLNQLLSSKDLEIEKLTRRVDGVTEMWRLSDSRRLSKELQAYIGRCDALQKTNEELKLSVNELEGALVSTREDHERAFRDRESMQNLMTERDSLVAMLETNDVECSRMLDEIKELTMTNENIQTEMRKYKSEIAKLKEIEKQVSDENDKLVQKLELMKIENKMLEKEAQKLKEENEDLEKQIEEMREKIRQLDEENKDLEDKVVEMDTYRERVTDMEEQIEELTGQNEHLRGRIGNVIHDNINLVARLEMMNTTSPKKATNKLMDMIEKYKDTQTPMSMEPEATDYDLSERSEPSSFQNRVKIIPELAETRKLNTMNAIKFGMVKSNTPRPMTPEPPEQNRMVFRQTGSLTRTFSVRDSSLEDSYNDNLSLSNYEELGISDGKEKPDFLKTAITFLSKKLNFK